MHSNSCQHVKSRLDVNNLLCVDRAFIVQVEGFPETSLVMYIEIAYTVVRM